MLKFVAGLRALFKSTLQLLNVSDDVTGTPVTSYPHSRQFSYSKVIAVGYD